jgi:iron complex transport system substrate-binding protein
METGGITDALGRSYAQSEKPNRIVSLVPAVTEILFAIGAGEKVVGVTQYCDYPPEAKSKTSVGGFSGATVSMEIIRSLEPDLVILSAEMHARVVSLLDGLGISVFAVEPRDFFGVYDTIAVLGEISGCLSGAEDVINEMKNKIDAVEERIRGKEKPAVFWVLGEDPLMTAGGGTFVNEAINLGGGRNIFENIGNQWALVSFEQVLLGKPDWVLAGNDLGTDLLKNPLWRNIQAVREGRFAVVNADILYRYGPRLAEGVELLAEILHRIRI